MASRDNPVQIKQLRDFTGGMVRPRTSGFVMGANVLEDVTNMFYDESGRLYSAGLSMITNTDSGATPKYNTNTSAIRDVIYWDPYIFIVDEDYSVWSNLYTNWDFSGTPDVTIEYSYSSWAPLGDTMYVSYTTGDTHKFTGGTWSTITDHTLDGGGGEFPQAAVILNAHDRMFAFNLGGSYKSRLYFSDPGDAETWQSDNWIDVGVDDSERIVTAILYRNVIIIFKETAVWMLSGTDPDSFTLTRLSDTFGTSGYNNAFARAAAVGDRYLYWIDTNSGGVVTFDGTDITTLDPPVPQGSGSFTSIEPSRMFYHEHRLYVSAGSTYHGDNVTYVFDTRTRTWTSTSWSFDCFASYPSPYQYYTFILLGGVHFHGATSDEQGLYLFDSFNYNYELQDGLTDYPTWSLKTGWISLVDLATRFRIKYVDVLLASNNVATDAPVTITMYTNYDLGASATKTFTWGQGGNAQRLRLPAKLDLASGPRRIESIQIEVSTDGSASCPASLVGIDIGFSVPPIRQRGARLITEVAS